MDLHRPAAAGVFLAQEQQQCCLVFLYLIFRRFAFAIDDLANDIIELVFLSRIIEYILKSMVGRLAAPRSKEVDTLRQRITDRYYSDWDVRVATGQ